MYNFVLTFMSLHIGRKTSNTYEIAHVSPKNWFPRFSICLHPFCRIMYISSTLIPQKLSLIKRQIFCTVDFMASWWPSLTNTSLIKFGKRGRRLTNWKEFRTKMLKINYLAESTKSWNNQLKVDHQIDETLLSYFNTWTEHHKQHTLNELCYFWISLFFSFIGENIT